MSSYTSCIDMEYSVGEFMVISINHGHRETGTLAELRQFSCSD